MYVCVKCIRGNERRRKKKTFYYPPDHCYFFFFYYYCSGPNDNTYYDYYYYYYYILMRYHYICYKPTFRVAVSVSWCLSRRTHSSHRNKQNWKFVPEKIMEYIFFHFLPVFIFMVINQKYSKLVIHERNLRCEVKYLYICMYVYITYTF